MGGGRGEDGRGDGRRGREWERGGGRGRDGRGDGRGEEGEVGMREGRGGWERGWEMGGGGEGRRGRRERRIHNPWTTVSVEIGLSPMTKSVCFLLQCVSYHYSTTLEELRIHTSTTEFQKFHCRLGTRLWSLLQQYTMSPTHRREPPKKKPDSPPLPPSKQADYSLTPTHPLK